MTTVAIMQPTYLPWLGYLALIDQADVFVLLDDVQFERRSWQQRNRIKGPAGAVTLTVPVHKAPRETRIRDIRVNFDHNFPEAHRATIEHAYKRASHFADYQEELAAHFDDPPSLLHELNVKLIHWMAAKLEAVARFVSSSALAATGRKDAYLAAICEELGATEYLSPQGSRDYLAESSFFRHIPVRYLEFDHPTYPQLHGPFVSHLSAVDLLFNVGPGASDVLRAGYRRQ